MKHPRLALFGTCMILLLCGGCSQQTLSPTSSITNVTVAGITSFMHLGETARLSATAHLTGGGSQDVTEQAIWESLNPAIASVSATGLVTVFGAGDTVIRAIYNGKIGSLTVSILRSNLVSMTILPDINVLKVGQTYQFSPAVVFGPGVPPISFPAPNWSSTNSSVIAVEGQGTAAAKSAGEAIIEVAFYGQTATRPLRVEP